MPNGWAWYRLRDLFNVCSGKRVLQSEWKTAGIPFYRAREIAKLANTGYVDNDLFISQEHYDALKQTYGVPKVGDLMVTGVGTIGKVFIVNEIDCFYYKDASVLCFENCYHAIEPQFAKHMIDSSLLQKQIHGKTHGNTVDTITITIANNYLCVLPPLSEQKRIVNKINDLFEKIDRMEQSLK
ncbi:MAG: restriction endonuclease subunit S [Eubacteriales bacterium]|nr:restriction endonuclease subunit S [Eubacteriales bacterium]